VRDLKDMFHTLKPKFYPSRQRWTYACTSTSTTIPLQKDDQRLSDLGIGDGSTLLFKDLGPQIGYSTVFFWEYFGPLVVYALLYFCPPSLIYGSSVAHGAGGSKSWTQTLAMVYWVGHYAKRIYETFFVHRFSHATMPLFNLIKNCTYYWCFAAYVGYFVNHPLYTNPPIMQTYVALGFSLLCQVANYTCHVILAGLRPRSSTGGGGYVIPHGFLFEYITCPNYTAEILGWVGFTVATQTVAAGIFTLVGAGQMGQWAIGKHARLKRLFNGKDGVPRYPRNRWVMLPPFF
jgi:very-long-chain enoyl-CoA reductase